MSTPLITVSIRRENDVVFARQRAREVAGCLGFEPQDQTRIATAVSEIARNAFRYAGGGRVEFLLEKQPAPMLLIRIQDTGPGIVDVDAVFDGRYHSETGMGLGIIGARRLMDRFEIDSEPGRGTSVLLGKALPRHARLPEGPEITALVDALARTAPEDPLEEVQQQNQELLRTLDELRGRQEELARLNRELEDTNRGVVALYAELDEKADYLQRASELKTRFLSDMSHEFRTPLNSILSLTQILMDRLDGDLTPEQEKQVTFIQKSAYDLTELVNDLLDLAKVEAGKLTVRPAEFQVADLFGALRGMLRPLLAGNNSVSLFFEEPDSLPPMITDEGKVSQILRNFISNALKFSEHGEVRVWAQSGPDDTITFTVCDTGIGIAPEDHAWIFEEFTQVESTQKRRPKGTGLGLPLSKKLAMLLGGSVGLESELGRGSTFYATIPRVYPGPREEAPAPKKKWQMDPERVPVMVVEDNRETLFIYEKFLAGTAYQVIPARSVAEARWTLENIRPAAIVLDILLAGENTWDLLEELKSDESTRSIPILVVTVVDNERKVLMMGADDFAVKPVDRIWLLDHLDALVQTKERPKCLIVDDDEVSRYILKGILSDIPCRVLEACDGQQAIYLARQELPDAVFLDLQMPSQDGWEVLRTLKEDPITCIIPIIINTSLVLSQEERDVLESNTVAILSKQTSSRQAVRAQIWEALAQAGIGTPATRREADHA